MDNLKIISKLHQLETRKLTIEKVMYDIKSYYFEHGSINFTLSTNDFKRKSETNEYLEFDKELMYKYLSEELKSIEIDINENIAILSGGK